VGVKKPKYYIGIADNGIELRRHNSKITLCETKEHGIEITFQRFVGKKTVISKSFNVKGVAVTQLHLKPETMEQICHAWLHYLETKK
jgi:uncharacterized membrane protein